MKNINIQVISLVNSANIREELIDGETHVVVPATTLPFDIVMNGYLYPKDEIEKGYKTLENSPAPCPHPIIDGLIVSAYDPRAMNQFSVGAWNRNVEIKDNRVVMEKVINKRIAESTDKGRELLNAIYNGQPVHTSTGLSGKVEEKQGVSKGKEYNGIVRDMIFDHDAFLLHEPGAATPDDGVGVNINNSAINNNVVICNLTNQQKVISMKLNKEETGLIRNIFNKLLNSQETGEGKGDEEGVKPTEPEAGKGDTAATTETSSEAKPTEEEGAKPAGKEAGKSAEASGDKDKEKTGNEEAGSADLINAIEGLVSDIKNDMTAGFSAFEARLAAVETTVTKQGGKNLPLNNSNGGVTIEFNAPE